MSERSPLPSTVNKRVTFRLPEILHGFRCLKFMRNRETSYHKNFWNGRLNIPKNSILKRKSMNVHSNGFCKHSTIRAGFRIGWWPNLRLWIPDPEPSQTDSSVSGTLKRNSVLKTVLRIHDILGWIRIRIRGSMPLTNGSESGFGSGSWIRLLLFSSLTFKMPAKN